MFKYNIISAWEDKFNTKMTREQRKNKNKTYKDVT